MFNPLILKQDKKYDTTTIGDIKSNKTCFGFGYL